MRNEKIVFEFFSGDKIPGDAIFIKTERVLKWIPLANGYWVQEERIIYVYEMEGSRTTKEVKK